MLGLLGNWAIEKGGGEAAEFQQSKWVISSIIIVFEMSATLKAPCGLKVQPRSRQNVRVKAQIAEVLENASKKNAEVPPGLNKFSSRITQPKSQGASQAMLYATGLNEKSMNSPQVISAADDVCFRFSLIRASYY